MLPYWLIFTLCAAGAVQHKPDWRRPVQGGILLLLISVVVMLMIGLRFEVGGDWERYLAIFDYIHYLEFDDALAIGDPGYAALNWLGDRLGFDFWFVNLVCAAIFMWGLTQFIRKQPNPWLALVIAMPYLVIVVAMGYTRQAVAIGIMLAGISQLGDFRSFVRFGLYVMVAATFHKSAIIVLPLVGFSVTKNRYIMIGIGAAMGLMLYHLFLQSSVDQVLQNYEGDNYDSDGALVRVALNIVPAVLFLLFPTRFGFNDAARNLWRNFAFASFGALALLGIVESSTMVDRLALYLVPLQVAVLSRMPNAFSKDGTANGALVLGLIGYSALIQFVWLNYAIHSSMWLPYQLYPIF